MKTVISIICSVALLVAPVSSLNVEPDNITFEVKSGRVIPKSVTLKISCPDDADWIATYPAGFGGEKSGTGGGYITIHPLGDLSRAEDETDIVFKTETETFKVHITVKREKPINFDIRIFPEKRTFHPGGSGKFVFLLTCPDKNICGRVKFTEPAEHVSGRVAVIPNYLTPPGIATVGMGSSPSTNPGMFTLPVKAQSKNRKAGGTIKSDVVAVGELPENPTAEISTEQITFIPVLDEKEKIITITPPADEKKFIWEAVPNQPWIDITPSHGKGKATIKVSLFQDGLTEMVDEGSITLTFPGVKTVEKEIKVSLLPNPADHFILSPEIVQLGPPETLNRKPEISVDVLPGVSWEIVSKPDWLNVEPTSGTGVGKIACSTQKTIKGNKLLEGDLTVALKNYSEKRNIKIQYLSADNFIPGKITLKKVEGIYSGEIICSTFDTDEIIIIRQPENGWLVRVNSSEIPRLKICIKKLWGNKSEEMLSVYRLRSGFIPLIYKLKVILFD